jgi:protein-S-isoprenylcysteine O-methyltransferase Ste14
MKLGHFFFKYRSYTPLPFLVPMFLFGRPTTLTMIVGFLIVLTGELLRLWGVSYAGGETRTRKVGASNLVTQGPFSYFRNPLYFGNIMIYFGISIMSNSLFPFLQILALVYFYIQYYYIITEEEEPFLKSSFKEKYDDYCNSVKRFIPGTAYDKSKQSKVKFDLKAGYKSEKRTLQGMSTIVFMVVLIYILTHQ